ncbi:hypothetical protein [Chryseobacterium sp. HSC-36S06]|uniref:hypothetical protein n=1 Tax=Chryseobacterium sp. HSC-36S06 TaxID=2910970 RepID=UPI00209F6273|nr:hypothetical protein [Chryseobacterium sp. HSC-36S06]MCP2038343.1 hypothetical protein [Chryseobacterium sp. HSC-36S06]
MENLENVFLAPKLVGKRFDDHAIPVELLEDFSVLQELLFEIAKDIYLKQNPERQRVPKGFTDEVYLKLIDVKPGSAIPNFILATALGVAPSLFPKNIEYFEQARTELISYVVQSEKNDIKPEFKDKYKMYFNRIGKNLLENESIILNPKSTSDYKASINKTTRKQIILSSNNKEYSNTIFINAVVHEMNKENGTFGIMFENKIFQDISYDNHFETIKNAFDDFENKPLVSIKASGIYNSNDKLKKIEEIESVDILDPLDISVRLKNLAELNEGWLNGEGKKLNEEKLEQFENLFNLYFNPHHPLPAIYPTIEGNIQLEWTIEEYEISLDINLKDLSADYLCSNLSNDSSKELEIDNLSLPENWESINNELAKFSV